MTRSEAKDAMFQMLLTAWQGLGLDTNRLIWPGFDNTAPSGTEPWGRITTAHGDAPMRAFGDGAALHENTGVMTIQVFTVAGNGTEQCDAIAQGLLNAIRAAKLDVWFRNARAKEVGTSGGFEQVNVISNFVYD